MKKLLKALVILTIAALVVACGAKPGDDKVEGPVVLKVWGAQEDQELLTERVDAFKAATPDIEWEITLGVVGEPDAYDMVTQDLETAADVFTFANDQIFDFVGAGALYEVTRNKDEIVSANVAGSIEAAEVDGKLYAYPMTADNGYFMYYDASVFTEDDVKSLDKMLEVANAANKKVFMDVSNGWYIASFFLGAGNTLDIKDGKQVTDFNNETGVKVGEAIRDFTAHNAFLTGDDAILQAGMGDTIAAGVSGTWTADGIQAALGENYRATKLPEFNLGGTQTQMGSFAGYKFMGVKTSTKHPVQAMMLAEFLTNEESQVKRFEARGMGPSNIKAGASDEVQANVALAALAEQAAYAQGQKNVLGSYWAPAEAFGTELEAKSTKDIKTMLDEMVTQIEEAQ
ncbi:MAG: extracellular solute-binding protein [Erysipelothrix sp.]|nr:extracellular solute-binding protein [Erysipelothrix sp.]